MREMQVGKGVTDEDAFYDSFLDSGFQYIQREPPCPLMIPGHEIQCGGSGSRSLLRGVRSPNRKCMNRQAAEAYWSEYCQTMCPITELIKVGKPMRLALFHLPGSLTKKLTLLYLIAGYYWYFTCF